VTGIKIDNSEEIDGVDFSPLLSSGSNLNRNEMYWYYPHYHGSGWTPGAAIRQGKWKLIEFYETGKVELYDLSIDISEKNDVSQVYPDKTIELKKRLKELLKRHNAQQATVNNTLIKK